MYTGVSGFDNESVLSGRPYGGCAILWHSNMCVNAVPINVDSRRICAVSLSHESWKLVVVNVYMPFENGDSNTDELMYLLSLIEDMMVSNADSLFVIGGDFNVDFSRLCRHTAILDRFCTDVGLMPADRHSLCCVDYTYQFCMHRFSTLDHFLLSPILFDTCVDRIEVSHCADNTSDHDPLFLRLNLSLSRIELEKHVFRAQLSWSTATEKDLNSYRNNLIQNLNTIPIPHAALLCHNMKCIDKHHYNEINQYLSDITTSLTVAGHANIPYTTNRKNSGRIPGWSDEVEPLRQKSLFWHNIWIDCGRPRNGPVADCMRRTRASYHYAIRPVRKNEEQIVRDRIANSLLQDPSRNFWREIRKIRSNKTASCRVIDGHSDKSHIANMFASKYSDLYSSVSYNKRDLQCVIDDVEGNILSDGTYEDCAVSGGDVMDAILCLKSGKNDGSHILSSDHFTNAGAELSVHIAILFSAIISHGTVPTDLVTSTILPIPKVKCVSSVSSDNFRGIALSSIFVKLFDNIVIRRYYDQLCTSELQFGFKQKSSTHMCTMVLKETMSYYVHNSSPVYCIFRRN